MKKRKNDKTVWDTDYNIPKFGFKSAMIIFLGEILISVLIVYICDVIKIDNKLVLTILSPLSFSLLVCYTRFFIETKRGFVKEFFITLIILFILFVIVFYLLLYKNLVI